MPMRSMAASEAGQCRHRQKTPAKPADESEAMGREGGNEDGSSYWEARHLPEPVAASWRSGAPSGSVARPSAALPQGRFMRLVTRRLASLQLERDPHNCPEVGWARMRKNRKPRPAG